MIALAPTIGVAYQSFLNGGLPNSYGFIATYIAGGTTPQATYTTSTGNVANDNPIALDASGRPPSEIWFTVGVAYRIDILDANSNLIKTYDNLSGQAYITNIYPISLFGNSLSAAIASLGSTVCTLLIPTQVTMTQNSTVPTTMALAIVKGGSIVTTGYELTLNGPLEAGIYQIFSGTGEVHFGRGSIDEAYPEWWGAGTSTIQNACDALAPYGGTVQLTNAAYANTSVILDSTDYDGIIIQGSSARYSHVTLSSAGTAIQLGDDPGGIANVILRDFYLSTPNSDIMIDVLNASQCEIRKIGIDSNGGGLGTKGIALFKSMSTVIDEISYGGNVNAEIGIYIADDSDGTVISNSYVKGEATACTYSIYIDGAGSHANTLIQGNIIGSSNTSSIIVAAMGNTPLVQIKDNFFEGSAGAQVAYIQLGNDTGPISAQNIEITGNYFYDPIRAGILLQCAIRANINENNFFSSGTYDIVFNSNVGRNAYIDATLNTPSSPSTHISIGAAQNNVRWQDGDGLFHDRLNCITNPGGDVWNPGTVTNGTSVKQDITLTGVASTYRCEASFNIDLQGMSITAQYKSANTITAVISNLTGGDKTPGAGVVRGFAYPT